MADVLSTGTVSLASPLIPANCKHNMIAGEAIVAGQACYIKAADGRAWLSDGSAADALAQVDGFAAESASVGEPVTLVFNVTLRYATALTPGAKLYLSVNPGLLADAASTGGTAWVGKVVDATRLYVQKSTY